MVLVFGFDAAGLVPTVVMGGVWFLVFLVDLFRVGVHCFEVVCELRLFCRLLPCVLALSSSGI
ncbi:hypothetical protein L195_g005371 [Trifolium pratense]|uniref:Transmembrane protein n=1 Tax=Trifolium pratense TaxID=57577 RepID=A0A2K3P0L7_TRIPR|nr:hypothetical protein L195_g005371 [Trifolium pratense]